MTSNQFVIHVAVIHICGLSFKSRMTCACVTGYNALLVWVQDSAGCGQAVLTVIQDQHFKTQWTLYVPLVQYSTILPSAHTVYLCVLCGSQNKQPLFPYTTLTDWFL